LIRAFLEQAQLALGQTRKKAMTRGRKTPARGILPAPVFFQPL
jgi:hypothetical protein